MYSKENNNAPYEPTNDEERQTYQRLHQLAKEATPLEMKLMTP